MICGCGEYTVFADEGYKDVIRIGDSNRGRRNLGFKQNDAWGV